MPGPIDLTPFGFTATESQVYGALLRLGPSTGYAVAHAARIARANTYGALEGLAGRAAAIRLPGRPARYRAVDPRALIAQLAAEQGQALDPAHRRRPGGRGQRGGGGGDSDLELTPRDPGGGARGATESWVNRLLVCGLAVAACRAPTIPEASRFPAGTRFTARHVTVDGTTLRYIDAGHGTPVVFIHGLGASMYAWRKNLEPVAAAGYRVIAFDNRGFGFSDKPATGYDNAAYARLTVALLDSLHLPDAVLVGHSMGGAVAAEVAIAHPERVRGLVLIGSAGARARGRRAVPAGGRALVWPLLVAVPGRGAP